MTLHAGMDTPMQREHERRMLESHRAVIEQQAERIAELEAKYEALVEHHAIFDNPADAWANSKAWEHRCKALEANNARLREAAVRVCGEYDGPYSDELFRATCETPADSLAAVKREAMEKMRAAIIERLTADGFIKEGKPAVRLCVNGVEVDA